MKFYKFFIAIIVIGIIAAGIGMCITKRSEILGASKTSNKAVVYSLATVDIGGVI